MSTKDSASDKMVASIRKTRAQSSAGNKNVRKQSDSPAPRKSAAAKKSTVKPKSRKEKLVDLFQSGRRVWPD